MLIFDMSCLIISRHEQMSMIFACRASGFAFARRYAAMLSPIHAADSIFLRRHAAALPLPQRHFATPPECADMPPLSFDADAAAAADFARVRPWRC